MRLCFVVLMLACLAVPAFSSGEFGRDYEAEYQLLRADGSVVMERTEGRFGDLELTRQINYGRTLRMITDWKSLGRFSINDNVGLVTYASIEGYVRQPSGPIDTLDPATNCTSYTAGGKVFKHGAYLRSEQFMGYRAAVIDFSGSTEWRSPETGCLLLKFDTGSSIQILVAYRTTPTPSFYQISEKYKRVDPYNYHLLGYRALGMPEDKAKEEAKKSAELDTKYFDSLFMVPEYLKLKITYQRPPQ